MYCRQCGKEIKEANFCPYCSAEQGKQEETTQQVNDQEYQPIHQQEYQQSYSAYGDEPNIGFSILSFFIPIVGLVLFLVWNKQYPKKAKSCLKGLIAGVVSYVILVCCATSMMGKAISDNGYSQSDLYNSGDIDNGLYNSVIQTIPYK